MSQGFVSSSGPIVERTDSYELTSGRTIAWSYVIPKIYESPLFGYGRQAMIREGLYRKIMEDYDEGETFPHPHNAYLELLLDNGVFGFLLVIPLYIVVLVLSVRILLDRSDPLYATIGGTCCALVLALLIASMGSQTFYPREGAVGMWAAIGLMLRAHVERLRSRTWGTPLFADEENDLINEAPEPSLQPA
jgi:O-antigen ligase